MNAKACYHPPNLTLCTGYTMIKQSRVECYVPLLPPLPSGMLKNKKTYEIIAPETIGYFRGENDVGVVMGKHSGRHALKSKLGLLGFSLEGDALDEVFNRFKLVAEQKTGGVDDEEIIALVTCGANVEESTVSWKLLDVQVVCGTMVRRGVWAVGAVFGENLF